MHVSHRQVGALHKDREIHLAAASEVLDVAVACREPGAGQGASTAGGTSAAWDLPSQRGNTGLVEICNQLTALGASAGGSAAGDATHNNAAAQPEGRLQQRAHDHTPPRTSILPPRHRPGGLGSDALPLWSACGHLAQQCTLGLCRASSRATQQVWPCAEGSVVASSRAAHHNPCGVMWADRTCPALCTVY